MFWEEEKRNFHICGDCTPMLVVFWNSLLSQIYWWATITPSQGIPRVVSPLIRQVTMGQFQRGLTRQPDRNKCVLPPPPVNVNYPAWHIQSGRDGWCWWVGQPYFLLPLCLIWLNDQVIQFYVTTTAYSVSMVPRSGSPMVLELYKSYVIHSRAILHTCSGWF